MEIKHYFFLLLTKNFYLQNDIIMYCIFYKKEDKYKVHIPIINIIVITYWYSKYYNFNYSKNSLSNILYIKECNFEIFTNLNSTNILLYIF